MKALVKFTANVGGKSKTFRVGDKITAEEAKEMGLKNKTHLAKADKPKP